MTLTPGLSLDEDHAYRLHGKEIPSVTQVLDYVGLAPKPPGGYPAWSTARGNRLHHLIQEHVEGSGVVTQGIAPACEVIRRARSRPGASVELSEVSLATEEVAGTLDYAMVYEEIGAGLWDWKAGGFQRWHAIQMGGYIWILSANGIVVSRAEVVYLGEGRSRPVDPGAAMAAFGSALMVYKFLKEQARVGRSGKAYETISSDWPGPRASKERTVRLLGSPERDAPVGGGADLGEGSGGEPSRVGN